MAVTRQGSGGRPKEAKGTRGAKGAKLHERVACVNLPHVAVALEERTNPELAGRPFAVESALPGPHLVHDLSLAAHRAGVRQGMSLNQARKVCPEIAIRPPRPEAYAETFKALLGVLTDFTAAVEPANLERSWLSTTGLAARESLERPLAEELVNRVRHEVDLAPRVGLAHGKETSRIVTQVLGEGLMVLPRGHEVPFLGGLAVAYLPLEAEAIGRIVQLGLTKVHQYASLPAAGILPRFGYRGLRAYLLSHGQDDPRVQPYREAPVFEATHGFLEPMQDLEMLRRLLEHLAGLVARPLGEAFLMAQCLTVTILFENGEQITRKRTMDEPVVSAQAFAGHAATLLAEEAWAAPIERVTLAAQGLCPTVGRQLDLFRREHAMRQGVDRTLRRLQAKFGPEVVQQGHRLEPASPLPERRAYSSPWAA